MGKPSKEAILKEKNEQAKKEQKKVESESESESEGDDEQDQEWWEQKNIEFAGRGEKRWDTLEHNGVLFAPPYVPHHVPIYYNGIEFKMTPEEEEVATMFASMKESDYYRNEIFRKNFFSEWRKFLDKRGSHPIKSLELVDFEPVWLWFQAERQKKKNMTKEEKKALKAENDKLCEPYKFCLWNGKKEQVANFRIEPPGLFRGRGKHPLTGMLKRRVQPEDVTINIGEGAKVPEPPKGHKWAEVRHDNTVTWLAMWKDNVTANFKYVMLGASSSVKGMSDMMKFEKARKLKDHIESVRANYLRDFHSKSLFERQRAVCTYFIDKLALRVGNEKKEDEADTVGCCSLRVEHVKPIEGCQLYFNFLGKDSIRFENTVEVLPEVHRLITQFTEGKHPKAGIFSEVDPSMLNDFFKSIMPGLSAKVFRTYNASICLQQYFKENPTTPKMTEAEKLVYFNTANTKVALLCNHQRSVSKAHAGQMAVLDMKIEHIKDLIERYKKLKPKAAKDYEKAAKEFFEEEDKIQKLWLDEYGTDVQRAEYAEIVAQRGAPRPRKVKEEVSEDEAVTSTPAQKGAKKAPVKVKEEPKKRGRVKEEPESSEDELVSSVLAKKPAGKKSASAAPPPKKASKPEPKPAAKPQPKKGAKKGKKEEDSDDDVKIGNL